MTVSTVVNPATLHINRSTQANFHKTGGYYNEYNPGYEQKTIVATSTGPLNGIRVIDFGHYIAGPLCGMLLADQGADVIHINRPGCAQSDTPEAAVFNRNKRCIELDLKQSNDLNQAMQLVASADVVIENFRPGVMQRLGLDAATLTAINPGLVYLSLPGFSSTDTGNASIRAFEGIIGAATGLFTDLQELRRLLGGRPVYTPVPVASTYGAIHGATAVTLALYRRETTGAGEQIEVPLAAAALSALAVINMEIQGKPARYDAPALTEQEKRSVSLWRSQVKQQGDSALASIATELIDQNQPTTANYQAADGNWIYFVGSGHGPNTRKILQTLEIYDELISEGMVDLPVYENLHRTDNIADGPGWSRQWNRHVRRLITERVSQKTAHVWEHVLIANGIPATAHRTSCEWLNAPEALAAGLVVDVEDERYGTIRQIGVQTTLSSSPQSQYQPSGAKKAGIEELLSGTAGRTVQPDTVADGSALLKGLRVLDLSNVLAGPVAGRTLAEYGAEVIKIDPPEPNFGPRISCMFPIEASPGKRSLLLDITSQRGKKVFFDLLKTSDVLVHNFRPGAPEKMGIEYDTLKRFKPDLIYLNISAFNGPLAGPWSHRAGFDPVLQAATGIQLRYGGEAQPPRYHGWASCIDYITGFSGAYGVALSLFRGKREKSDAGDLVRTSLAQGAQLVQSTLLIGTKDRQPGKEVHGQSAMGEHALYRLYQASDGWFFIAALPTEKYLLSKVSESNELSGDALEHDGKLQECLQQKFLLKPVSHWVEVFNRAGIGAHAVDTLHEVGERYLHEGTTEALQSSWDDGRTLSWVRFTDHPTGGSVELSAPAYVRLQSAKIRLLKPTPKQGAHTLEILIELGYSEADISELLSDGVVREQLHDDYLPE